MENVKVVKITTEDNTSSFYNIITVSFSDGTIDKYKVYVPYCFIVGSEYCSGAGLVPIWMSFKKYMKFPKLIKSGCSKDDFLSELNNKVENFIKLYYSICDRTDDPLLNYRRDHGFGYKKADYTGKVIKEIYQNA